MRYKKYKILEDGRIQALRNGPWGPIGTLGGYIESERNLSHDGPCWIYDDARVSGNAQVTGYARAHQCAHIFDNAKVDGNAHISGDAQVYGSAQIYENATVRGQAKVFDDAQVFGNTWISDNVWVYGNVIVFGTARINKNVQISGNIIVQHGILDGKYTTVNLRKDEDFPHTCILVGNKFLCGCQMTRRIEKYLALKS